MRTTLAKPPHTFHPAVHTASHAKAGAVKAPAAVGATGSKLATVRLFAQAAKAAGVPPELPIMTALVETNFQNLTWGDRDSIGYFQQRNAWGSRADRLNPASAVHMFLHGGKGGQPGAVAYKRQFGGAHDAATLGRWAQAVQQSAFPGRYAQRFSQARALLRSAGVA